MAPVLARGSGAHVWDLDGNEFIEYGMGLRSVTLGHGHPRVLSAVRAVLEDGVSFTRPTELELAAAEDFLALVPGADMVKFAKNRFRCDERRGPLGPRRDRSRAHRDRRSALLLDR